MREHSRSRSEVRTGWRLLSSVLLGTALGLPTLPFYTIGIFAPVLSAQFGWSFANIFGGLIITTLVLLVGGPIVGHIVDRRGARVVAAASLAGLGLGYMTLALLDGSIIHYYASWLLLSVAGLGATPISFTRAINTAFVEQRGLALGIALSGIGVCALLVKPFAEALVGVAGWRMAFVAVGSLPLLIGAPVVYFFMRADAGTNQTPVRTFQVQIPALTLKEAVRTRAFAILVVTFVVISFANGAPIPHLENILRSVHVDPGEIVTLTSFIGVAVIAGRLLGGWLLDRVWAPIIGIVVAAGAAGGCWMLAQDTLTATEALVAIVLLGFAGGVEGDLLAYLIARYLGVRSYGAVYGTIFGLFALGAGAGPALLGHSYDRAGNYSSAMQVCTLLLLLAAGLLFGLGRYPDREEA